MGNKLGSAGLLLFLFAVCGRAQVRLSAYALTGVTVIDDAGFSPFDALVAATRNGADALGLADRAGTIAVGREADLVVLNKNPLDDIDNESAVFLVVKRGAIFTPGADGADLDNF